MFARSGKSRGVPSGRVRESDGGEVTSPSPAGAPLYLPPGLGQLFPYPRLKAVVKCLQQILIPLENPTK